MLTRRTPLARKTRLKPRSAKRARLYREERVPLVVRLLAERPLCEAGPVIRMADPNHRCSGRSVDLHEVKTRARGGSITDPENILCVCRECHTWIGNNVLISTELGLLKHSWED